MGLSGRGVGGLETPIVGVGVVGEGGGWCDPVSKRSYHRKKRRKGGLDKRGVCLSAPTPRAVEGSWRCGTVPRCARGAIGTKKQ